MMDPDKDLYAILEVSPLASQQEIRRAYRRLARRFHPDAQTDEVSPGRFREVQEAYRVLGDPASRQAYDRLRAERGPEAGAGLGMHILLSRRVLPAIPEEQMLYVLLEIYAPSTAQPVRRSLNICLVVDCSTSMRGERLENVKKAAHLIVDDLGADTTLGIVAFSDRAEVVLPVRPLDDLSRVHSAISSVWARGGTEILQGLQAGLEQLRRFHREGVVSHLLLLSDGRTYGDEEKCIAEARRAGVEGISISALGIGEDWNDMFMDELVRQASGRSAYISHPRQIMQALKERVEGLGELFAQNMELTVRLADNVRLEQAFRVSPYFDQLPVTDGLLKLGMIRARDRTLVLLEMVVSETPPGRRRLFQLDLRADVIEREQQARLLVEQEVEFTAKPPTELPPTAIVNAMGRLSVYRMQEQAWAALEEGRGEEARQRLEQVATRLLDMGEHELARRALLEAGRLAQGGTVSEKGRKTIRYGTRGLNI